MLVKMLVYVTLAVVLLAVPFCRAQAMDLDLSSGVQQKCIVPPDEQGGAEGCGGGKGKIPTRIASYAVSLGCRGVDAVLNENVLSPATG
ncbi:hypothetical protein ZHAS_00006818 [Anopheles sinensis]|uniref:Uncharacterized protein n=1 Tax=Anopheles sinensis TaxID=74873 RepID=A0A084VN47_ANOSI|nr:hypothetical protein ZHAS_00006818 [Anopheles sinensis]